MFQTKRPDWKPNAFALRTGLSAERQQKKTWTVQSKMVTCTYYACSIYFTHLLCIISVVFQDCVQGWGVAIWCDGGESPDIDQAQDVNCGQPRMARARFWRCSFGSVSTDGCVRELHVAHSLLGPVRVVTNVDDSECGFRQELHEIVPRSGVRLEGEADFAGEEKPKNQSKGVKKNLNHGKGNVSKLWGAVNLKNEAHLRCQPLRENRICVPLGGFHFFFVPRQFLPPFAAAAAPVRGQ